MSDVQLEELLDAQVLSKHLLPTLALDDTLALGKTSRDLRNLVRTAPDSAWRKAAAHRVPANHPLAITCTYEAALRYLESKQAIGKGAACSQGCAWRCAHISLMPLVPVPVHASCRRFAVLRSICVQAAAGSPLCWALVPFT